MPRIIPVVDLLGGRVVRAVGGRRHDYLPVVSRLTDSEDPVDIARALLAVTGSKELYLADLDAITGHGIPSPAAERLVASLDATILFDHGKRGFLYTNTNQPNVNPILASETISAEILPQLRSHQPEKWIFSFDLMNGDSIHTMLGTVLGIDKQAFSDTADLVAACVRRLLEYDVRRFIILDLYEVGMSRGLRTLPICRLLKEQFSNIEIITGGGISSYEDIQKAGDAGVDAVLVATALHNGTLK